MLSLRRQCVATLVMDEKTAQVDHLTRIRRGDRCRQLWEVDLKIMLNSHSIPVTISANTEDFAPVVRDRPDGSPSGTWSFLAEMDIPVATASQERLKNYVTNGWGITIWSDGGASRPEFEGGLNAGQAGD